MEHIRDVLELLDVPTRERVDEASPEGGRPNVLDVLQEQYGQEYFRYGRAA